MVPPIGRLEGRGAKLFPRGFGDYFKRKGPFDELSPGGHPLIL